MRIKKRRKREIRYIPLDDIEKINDEFLTEMERVKTRLGYVRDVSIINAFQEVLLTAYNAAIEIKALECAVDYDIKIAEIEQRRHALKPWRRCWLWRLLFMPLTNRAQDIIEERADVQADIIHTAAEKEIEEARKILPSDSSEKLSKCEQKLRMQDKLSAAINKADNADLNEVLNELPANQNETQQGAKTPERVSEGKAEEPKPAGQLPGQITLDEVQGQQQTVGTRRPRPPRSCRKPTTQG